MSIHWERLKDKPLPWCSCTIAAKNPEACDACSIRPKTWPAVGSTGGDPEKEEVLHGRK